MHQLDTVRSVQLDVEQPRYRPIQICSLFIANYSEGSCSVERCFLLIDPSCNASPQQKNAIIRLLVRHSAVAEGRRHGFESGGGNFF